MIPQDIVPVANHLWQSTLFAAAVWVITLVLRENRAAVRHALWFAASVKFLVPFSLLVSIGSRLQWPAAVPSASRVSVLVAAIGEPFGASASPATIGSASSSSPLSLVSAVLLFIWTLGSLASIFWWTIHWLQLRRTLQRATPLSLDFPIRVRSHQGRLEPGVFGIFRPVLLLPEGITNHLSPLHMQAVLAHELCHVRRRDNLTAAIHILVETVFWFHPVVWWIKLRLVDEQERACDQEVLRLGCNPQIYAESILKVCECYLTAPSLCVSGISSSHLKRRIGEIMKNHVALQLSLSRAVLLAIAAVSALAGPVLLGIERGIPAEASPAGIGEARPSPAPQGGPRGGGPDTSSVQGYRIGEIRVTGTRLFNDDRIRSVLGLTSGEVYDELQLRKGFEDLQRLYGNRGYINFLPQPVFDVDEQRKLVNLTINISEGLPFVVNRISFTGNTTTTDETLRREILIKEGEVFNASLLELSRARLNQLGTLEEVKIEDYWVRPSSEEGRVDISLRVKEKGR